MGTYHQLFTFELDDWVIAVEVEFDSTGEADSVASFEATHPENGWSTRRLSSMADMAFVEWWIDDERREGWLEEWLLAEADADSEAEASWYDEEGR